MAFKDVKTIVLLFIQYEVKQTEDSPLSTSVPELLMRKPNPAGKAQRF